MMNRPKLGSWTEEIGGGLKDNFQFLELSMIPLFWVINIAAFLMNPSAIKFIMPLWVSPYMMRYVLIMSLETRKYVKRKSVKL